PSTSTHRRVRMSERMAVRPQAEPTSPVAQSSPAASAPTPSGRPRKKRRSAVARLRSTALTALPFVLVISLWAGASSAGLIDPLLIPGPKAVADALWDGLVGSGSMWDDV